MKLTITSVGTGKAKKKTFVLLTPEQIKDLLYYELNKKEVHKLVIQKR